MGEGTWEMQQFTLDQMIENGMLDHDRAFRQSEENSGVIIGRVHTKVEGDRAIPIEDEDPGTSGEGIVVRMKHGGEQRFINSAALLEFVRRTGGVINNQDGTRAYGEDMNTRLQRLGKL